MKDFGMNGIQSIVDAMFKSQWEEMVEHASEMEVHSGPSDNFLFATKGATDYWTLPTVCLHKDVWHHK